MKFLFDENISYRIVKKLKEDLANLLSFPPKVILLKTGNCSTNYLINLLQNGLEEITAFNKSEIHGVMEIS